MHHKTFKALLTLLVVIGIAYLVLPTDLMARAGGGGSYSGGSFHSSYSSSSGSGGAGGGVIGGGIMGVGLILWGFVIAIVSSISSFFAGMKIKEMIIRKNERAREMLEKIDDNDTIWDREKIRARIEEIYFAVQDAWTKRDQNIAKEYMSQRIYKKHKQQTDAMKADKLT